MEHSGATKETETTTYDVIVIGGGVMGSSTAYQTAKRGSKTLLLEQFDFLHHRGSSHGESRNTHAAYPEDYYTPLVLESNALWRRAEAEIGYKVYFKAHGHLDMGPSESEIIRAVISTCRKHSLSHRLMDGPEVLREFSGRIQMPENWAAVYTEHGGAIKPTKAVCMFQTLALKNGAVLRDNTEAKEIKRGENGGVLVVAASGEVFSGRKCVVTAGAWTEKLVKTVSGVEIPIQPLETAIHYWRISEGHKGDYELNGEAGFPTFDDYGDPVIYGTPSFEFPGLIKVTVHGGQGCDPDARTWGPVPVLELREWIETRFAGRVDPTGPVNTILCMYSMTPDEDFVLDFLGGEFGKDVVVGGGFSGHGFKMAPAIGRVLADLALNGATEGVELDKFRIGRFEGNPRGNFKGF